MRGQKNKSESLILYYLCIYWRRYSLFASSLEWRKECEMRAHKIVESLIEPGITETQLIDSVSSHQSHARSY